MPPSVKGWQGTAKGTLRPCHVPQHSKSKLFFFKFLYCGMLSLQTMSCVNPIQKTRVGALWVEGGSRVGLGPQDSQRTTQRPLT